MERDLENLGKVKITAEQGLNETAYLLEIDKPVLLKWLDSRYIQSLSGTKECEEFILT